MMRSPVCHKLLMLTLAVSVSACSGNNMNDLKAYISEVRTKYQGEVEPLPEVVGYHSYSYQSNGKRDPFRPSLSTVKAIQQPTDSSVSPKAGRTQEELERYSLEALSMVGIMNNQGEIWAIIKAPDGNIYRVRKGNYMGKHHGKITRISEAKIELEEIVPNGYGGWQERPNKLELAQ